MNSFGLGWRKLFVGLITLTVTALPASPLYHAANRTPGWQRPGVSSRPDQFLDQVQPIINARCVACHGCYEAPCQLNLESYEGIRRGFNPEPIYSGKRFEATKPNRMIDASSIQQWRERAFLPVLAEGKDTDHTRSLFHRFLQQSADHNSPGFDVMNAADLQREILEKERHQCVATDAQIKSNFSEQNKWEVISFEELMEKTRFAGMPFALPKLETAEHETLKRWLAAGAPGPDATKQAALARPSNPAVIANWENFLNGDSAQAQQSARYIYEHVFTAQIHFAENPGEYFELVRSRTRTGDIDQIVTKLPYSHPGVSRAYYRLRKLTRALVQKTQIVWQVSNETLGHLTTLFHGEWDTDDIPLPFYGTVENPLANPFEYFASIPAAVRSRFMIENSRVIIGGMTQGSVCVGSRPTYAIRDHFWVWFLRPESDPSVQTPQLGLSSWDPLQTAPITWEPSTAAGRLFVQGLEGLDLLDFNVVKPIIGTFRRITGINLADGLEDGAVQIVIQLREHGVRTLEILGAVHHFLRSVSDNQEYLEAFERTLRIWLKDHNRRGLAVTDLWTGEGANPNAWINVTRHEKSASVQFGKAGGRPQNIWVLSYSNFERLYYNLVASFQNWESIAHRLATWRHMSYVRLEAEDLAISLLPAIHRTSTRNEFTRGIGELKNIAFFPQYSTGAMFSRPARRLIPFARPDLPERTDETPGLAADTADESLEKLLVKIEVQLSPVSTSSSVPAASEAQVRWEAPLIALGGRNQVRHGEVYPQFFPNITYLKVTLPSGQVWGYTLQADRGYKGNNIIFAEKLNQDPQYDSLAVYQGFVGAYPNLFLEITQAQLGQLVADIRAISTKEGWSAFQGRYGVARNSARFWPFFDWLHGWKALPQPGNDPVEQGIVDLSQYNVFAEPPAR